MSDEGSQAELSPGNPVAKDSTCEVEETKRLACRIHGEQQHGSRGRGGRHHISACLAARTAFEVRMAVSFMGVGDEYSTPRSQLRVP